MKRLKKNDEESEIGQLNGSHVQIRRIKAMQQLKMKDSISEHLEIQKHTVESVMIGIAIHGTFIEGGTASLRILKCQHLQALIQILRSTVQHRSSRQEDMLNQIRWKSHSRFDPQKIWAQLSKSKQDFGLDRNGEPKIGFIGDPSRRTLPKPQADLRFEEELGNFKGAISCDKATSSKLSIYLL